MIGTFGSGKDGKEGGVTGDVTAIAPLLSYIRSIDHPEQNDNNSTHEQMTGNGDCLADIGAQNNEIKSPRRSTRISLATSIQQTITATDDPQECRNGAAADDELVCDQCPLLTFTRDSLREHLRLVHFPHRCHPCPVCRKRFVFVDSLIGHLRDAHIPFPTETATVCEWEELCGLLASSGTDSVSCVYPCISCSAAISSTLNQLHERHLVLKCTSCGLLVTERHLVERLEVKQQKSANLHIFSCSVCREVVGDRSSLFIHCLEQHSAGGRCAFCSCSLSTFLQMALHSLLHFLLVELACWICDFRSYSRHHWQKHVVLHYTDSSGSLSPNSTAASSSTESLELPDTAIVSPNTTISELPGADVTRTPTASSKLPDTAIMSSTTTSSKLPHSAITFSTTASSKLPDTSIMSSTTASLKLPGGVISSTGSISGLTSAGFTYTLAELPNTISTYSAVDFPRLPNVNNTYTNIEVSELPSATDPCCVEMVDLPNTTFTSSTVQTSELSNFLSRPSIVMHTTLSTDMTPYSAETGFEPLITVDCSRSDHTAAFSTSPSVAHTHQFGVSVYNNLGVSHDDAFNISSSILPAIAPSNLSVVPVAEVKAMSTVDTYSVQKKAESIVTSSEPSIIPAATVAIATVPSGSPVITGIDQACSKIVMKTPTDPPIPRASASELARAVCNLPHGKRGRPKLHRDGNLKSGGRIIARSSAPSLSISPAHDSSNTGCSGDAFADNNGVIGGSADVVDVSGDVNANNLTNASGQFVCPVCLKRVASLISLKRHAVTHLDEFPFRCSVCSRGFKLAHYLSNHQRVHVSEKRYQCSVCEKTFRQRPDLNRHHLRFHSDEKRFQCSVCARRFSVKSDLSSHLQTHTGERRFQCDLCQLCFRTATKLNIHRRKHTGERPFTCEYCGKCFAHKFNLDCHLRIHTNNHRFRCERCYKGFDRQPLLQKHARVCTTKSTASASTTPKPTL